MVVGAPASAADPTVFYWQIYEIAHFGLGQTPTVTHVFGQPASSNNVSPIYGTDDHVIFTSDLPRNGAAYLCPQRDEYLLLPVVTGLWSLDPATGVYRRWQHSPSGSYSPFIDSFGRLLYSRWDHLSRDSEALTDRVAGPGDTYTQTDNGTFNYSDESAVAVPLNSRVETFPEPRPNDVSGLAGTNFRGRKLGLRLSHSKGERKANETIALYCSYQWFCPDFKGCRGACRAVFFLEARICL